jgi:Mg2+-importing ATPase
MGSDDFWKEPLEGLYDRLKSGPEGLAQADAEERLKAIGPNSLKAPQKWRGLTLFIAQFRSPLILLLIGAALLSFFLHDRTDSTIIFVIVILSGLLGFFQERGAVNALEKLLQMVENKATVRRDGKEVSIPLDQVVPGDIVILRSGDIIPADCVLLDEKQFYAEEAALTGESVPVDKNSGDPLYMGTIVSSGAGTALVVITGRATEYGHITEKARFRPPETAFELGVRKFGYFLMIVTVILVLVIFVINVIFNRPILSSFMFSLALAVGLTPQLLPAIISINLSHGARRMAQKRVVVKRLASIENFGQMDVLCADKTGTITEGKIVLDRSLDINGNPSEKAAYYGFLSAHFQTTYANPLDRAILEKLNFEIGDKQLTGEIPYDFERKRLSVIFGELLISKGAVPQILQTCDRLEEADGNIISIEERREGLEKYFEEQSAAGFRTLAVAYGETDREENLIFLGFLHFFDPIKPDVAKAVADLRQKGVNLKIITGDHHSVALHAAQAIGMSHRHLITGAELKNATEEEIKKIVREKNIFAEINPNEKEKIVLALRKAGHVVGYLGDGVNDVAALHSADVSIAVDSGAEAAKETADIVLLQKDLHVLREGIEEGRLTFANTMKYVYMATSANFGNMFSMAGASLFLPFLPLLPKQVLLLNLMTDIPEMAIATDRVDLDVVHRPIKWDLPFIRRFMLVFGLISSFLYFLKADESLFQTGWFVESVVSATLIVFAIRTRHSLFTSKPGRLLSFSILAIVIAVLFFPYIPFFGFVPLPLIFYVPLAAIVALYIGSVEVAKRLFFHKHYASSMSTSGSRSAER